jgi:hypothetical protein
VEGCSITLSSASLPRSCQISSAVKDRIGAIRRTTDCRMCHRALWAERRAADLAGGVEAVLEDVQIHGAQIFGGEVLQGLHDAVELEAA